MQMLKTSRKNVYYTAIILECPLTAACAAYRLSPLVDCYLEETKKERERKM